MRTMKIIRDLLDLIQNSEDSYARVIEVHQGRARVTELEAILQHRTTIANEMETAILNDNGPGGRGPVHAEYQELIERPFSGTKSDARNALEMLVKGEEYLLYRTRQAIAKVPTAASYLEGLSSVIANNMERLDVFLSQEEEREDIAVVGPNGEALPPASDHVTLPQTVAAQPVSEPRQMVSLPEPVVADARQELSGGEHEFIVDEAASVAPLARESAGFMNGALVAADVQDEVEDEDVIDLPVPAEPIAYDSATMDTALDAIPPQAFDHGFALELTQEAQDVADPLAGHGDDALERRVEEAVGFVPPTSPTARRNIMRKRFDPDAVRADANDVGNTISSL